MVPEERVLVMKVVHEIEVLTSPIEITTVPCALGGYVTE